MEQCIEGVRIVREVDTQPVSGTMFLSLIARAEESMGKKPLISDDEAVRAYKKFKYIHVNELPDRCTGASAAVRTHMLDALVSAFLEEKPEALCINIGAGLDTRFFRIDNGTLHWVDIDLPQAIEVRRLLIPEHERVTAIGCDALDPSWAGAVDACGRPVLIIAEGLLMYFDEEQVRGLLDTICSKFPGATLMIEYMSDRAVNDPRLLRLAGWADAGFRWGIANAGQVTRLEGRLSLIEDQRLSDCMYLKVPICRLFGRIEAVKSLSNGIGVYAISGHVTV